MEDNEASAISPCAGVAHKAPKSQRFAMCRAHSRFLAFVDPSRQVILSMSKQLTETPVGVGLNLLGAKGIATRGKDTTWSAPGLTTRSKKLLGTKGIASFRLLHALAILRAAIPRPLAAPESHLEHVNVRRVLMWFIRRDPGS